MNHQQENPQLEELLRYIRDQRGFDFTSYKRTTLYRRITKRMQEVDVETFGVYQDFLEVHPDEFHELFDTILINVTSFFRDQPAWTFLAEQIIPRILQQRRGSEPVRVWSAGCASGEEAYTIGMLLAEAVGDGWGDQIKVVVPELRRVAVFGRHDVIEDSPISRLDLLICRNTLMYFNREAQDRTLSRFHFALRDSGSLFLGRAEMLLTHADLFTPVHLRHRIFAKVPAERLMQPMLRLQRGSAISGEGILQERLSAAQEAYEAAEVAQAIVDVSGTLVLANQAARAMFGLTGDDYGKPVGELPVSEQVQDIQQRIREVVAKRSPVVMQGLRWVDARGVERYTNVYFVPLIAGDDSLETVSISFTDETAYHHLQEEMELTRNDLEEAYDDVQSANEALETANEELETSNEELQSANEELETTNEELQSTNEEMETMNEELQSTNEELQTINDELRERTEQLAESNSFLDSILSGMEMGVVVLDDSLEIRVWSRGAEELWGLRADEVLGEHFYNLDIGLPIDGLKKCIRAVQDSSSERETVELEATSRRGKSVRCLTTCARLEHIANGETGLLITMQT
jgi:two-component system CheB/CheR fusion protein